MLGYVNCVFVPEFQINREFILWFKEHFHLSWDDYRQVLGYADDGVIIQAKAHPERLTREAKERLRERHIVAWGKLEKERGHAHVVTVTTKKGRLPKRIRIAGEFRLCEGHREPTLFGSAQQRFCSDECKELYDRRRHRARKS